MCPTSSPYAKSWPISTIESPNRTGFAQMARQSSSGWSRLSAQWSSGGAAAAPDFSLGSGVGDWRRGGHARQLAAAYQLLGNVMQFAVVLLTRTHQHLKRSLSIEVVPGHQDADRCAGGAVGLQCLTQLSHGCLRRSDL